MAALRMTHLLWEMPSYATGVTPQQLWRGPLVLTGSNSYTGGTLVRGGILIAGPTSVNAFGTGNVTVNQAGTDSIARLQIQAGAVNAVNDLATLSLAGGTATA